MVVFNQERIISDHVLTLKKINIPENNIYLKDENENDFYLSIGQNSEIQLKTEKYENYWNKKIKVFDLNELDDFNFNLTEEYYPEIKLNITENEKKIYSLFEKKESLIESLIQNFKAFGDELKIKSINYVDIIIKLLSKKQTYDNSNDLDFIKNKKYNLPDYLIPIVSNKKNLFKKLMKKIIKWFWRYK